MIRRNYNEGEFTKFSHRMSTLRRTPLTARLGREFCFVSFSIHFDTDESNVAESRPFVQIANRSVIPLSES